MTKFLRIQFPIIVLSLALSFMLWLFVSGEDKTYHDLPVALELSGVSTSIDLGDAMPDTLSLRVNANKAQASFLDTRRLRLVVDGSRFEPGSNTVSFEPGEIEPKLPRGVDVLRLTPDTLTFVAYPYVTKELPVQVPERGSLRDYLERSGDPEIEPPTAKVTGPANRLESVNYLATAPLELSEIAGPGVTVALRPQSAGLDNRLVVSPPSFRVTPRVTVKRETLTFDVPLRLEDETAAGGRADGVDLRPAEVTVTVSWPLNLPVPSPDSDGGIRATVSVDPDTLERRKTMRLDVAASAPNQVEVLRVNPSRVMAVWQAPQARSMTAPRAVAPAPGGARGAIAGALSGGLPPAAASGPGSSGGDSSGEAASADAPSDGDSSGGESSGGESPGDAPAAGGSSGDAPSEGGSSGDAPSEGESSGAASGGSRSGGASADGSSSDAASSEAASSDGASSGGRAPGGASGDGPEAGTGGAE